MYKKMKICRLDGKGAAHNIDSTELDVTAGITWIQVDLSSAKTFFKKKFIPTPEFVMEALTAKETRPRTILYDDSLLLNLRGVNLNKGSDPEDMISIRAWVGENLIVTIQKRKLASIQEIEHRLDVGVGPKNTAEFIFVLTQGLTEKTAEVLTDIGAQLDDVEDKFTENALSTSRLALNDVRKRIILLRRYLVPQRNAITQLASNQLSWLGHINNARFHELTDMHIRIIEDLDAEREQANVMHEELFALSQEAINQKMYYLTIVAIIFMPLSFITGLLGINVGGIPGATFNHGFLSVSIILMIVFFLQLIYLKRKQWI